MAAALVEVGGPAMRRSDEKREERFGSVGRARGRGAELDRMEG
uniref:Uncharacterized protein n=1 Tax=Arundo donax TaxID=35708 RepID=A0A0A9G0V6_ARUDO